MVSFTRFQKRRQKSNEASSPTLMQPTFNGIGLSRLSRMFPKRFIQVPKKTLKPLLADNSSSKTSPPHRPATNNNLRPLRASSAGVSRSGEITTNAMSNASYYKLPYFVDRPPAPNNKHGPFDKLAPETIQAIAELLPPISNACLALCSRTLNRIIGTQSWAIIHSQREDHLEFCELLGRDLPEHVFCRLCLTIHRPSKLGGHCEKDVFHENQLHFRFLDFQLAMQRHHLGLTMNSFLEGLSIISTEARAGYMYQYTTEARIVSTSLLIRSQQWFMLPPGQAVDFPRDKITNVCSHLVHRPSRPDDSPDRLGALLRCRVQYNPNIMRCRLIECTGIKKCWYCNTEIQTDVKEFPNQGTAIVITAWRDFGEGRTPKDSIWRYQTANFVIPSEERWRLDYVNFEAGSIKSRFEDGKEFFFDSHLTEENKVALFARSPHPWIPRPKPTLNHLAEDPGQSKT